MQVNRGVGILVSAVLLAAPATWAQARHGGLAPSGGARVIMGPGHGFGRHGPCCGGLRSRRLPLSPGFGSVFLGVPYSYDETVAEPVVVQAPPQVVVVRDEGKSQAESPRLPADPKLIEVAPLGGEAAVSKRVVGPAVFVLSDGRQFQAQRYTITDRFVFLTEGLRKTRRLSIDELDVEKTIAANRDRGIELQFPAAGNEIFLSF